MNTTNNNVRGKRYLYAILSPLILVVIASIVTVYIAIRHADRPIEGGYTKVGLTIQRIDNGSEKQPFNNVILNSNCVESDLSSCRQRP